MAYTDDAQAIAYLTYNNNQQAITTQPMTATIPSNLLKYDPDDIERTFNHLVQEVLSETRSESSTQRIAIHLAYQQIIGLGQPVVPLLLRETEKKSGRWFWL